MAVSRARGQVSTYPGTGWTLPEKKKCVSFHVRAIAGDLTLCGFRYLYWLYIAIDACFRLKRRLVSSEKRDPDLDTGGTYFTEDGPFRQFLLGVTDQKEVHPT